MDIDQDMQGMQVIVLTTQPRALRPHLDRVHHDIADYFNIPRDRFTVWMEDHISTKGKGKGKDTTKGNTKGKRRPIGS